MLLPPLPTAAQADTETTTTTSGRGNTPQQQQQQKTEFPTALLTHILWYVPQQQRLQSAALVSKTWHAGAAAATTQVQCYVKQRTVTALQAWLDKHAEQLFSLQLEWWGVGVREGVTGQLQLPWAHLSQLQTLILSHIQLPGVRASVEADRLRRQQSSALTGPVLPKLKQLELDRCRLQTADCMVALSGSSQLTALKVTELHIARGASIMPLLLLINLQRLQLVCCKLLPAELLNVAQLQHLELSGCILLPWQGDSTAPEAVASLLQTLRAFTNLQHLELVDLQLHRAAAPYNDFSALTASSQLTALVVKQTGDEPPLPQPAVQHVFALDRQLPQLQHLAIVGDQPEIDDDYEEYCRLYAYGAEDDDDEPAPPASFSLYSEDLAHIIACCPALTALNITCAMHVDTGVTPLLHLPQSCTSLAVGGYACSNAAGQVVSQLTQLHSLTWDFPHGMDVAGLAQLTALSALTELRVALENDLSKVLLGPFCQGRPYAAYLHLKDEGEQVCWVWHEMGQVWSPMACWPRRLAWHNVLTYLHMYSAQAVVAAATLPHCYGCRSSFYCHAAVSAACRSPQCASSCVRCVHHTATSWCERIGCALK